MAHDDDDDAPDTIHEDDQAAYIFQPDIESPQAPPAKEPRSKKRRRTTGKRLASSPEPEPEPDAHSDEPAQNSNHVEVGPSSERYFVPLFNGAERAASVRKRAEAYHRCWSRTEMAVDRVLSAANSDTLAQVADFIRTSEEDGDNVLEGRMPTAFINTGPDVSSQELLFEKLATLLHSIGEGRSRVVRLKAADAGGTLKAILKRVIKEGMSRAVAAAAGGDEADALEDVVEETRVVGGRKYLEYDLEALAATVRVRRCRHVFVAFQDSETFDGGLLSDLIHLFSTWRSEIPFTLLFGISTSVELLQARLLNSTILLLYGAQFDVVQSTTIIQRLFKHAVAGQDIEVRLGPSLLRTFLERQRDQIAGVQAFVSSLRYAYMCYFYANPLSVLMSGSEGQPVEDSIVQKEHIDAVRTLYSFQHHVEQELEEGRIDRARSLLAGDDFLLETIQAIGADKNLWTKKLLRCLCLLEAIRPHDGDYSDAYILAMEDGIDPEADGALLKDPVRQMSVEGIIGLVERVISALDEGDSDVSLDGWAREAPEFYDKILKLREQATELQKEAATKKHELCSKYTSQSKRMRATVVAQRVQLTHHEAMLTDQDKAFTKIIDEMVDLLSEHTRCVPATDVFLHEAWLYDSRSPSCEVFVPRARLTLERSLRRPHDYLGCACCAGDGGKDGADDGSGLLPTLPTTALLYRLYMETGNLINVADLWTAFFGIVGDAEGSEDGLNEKTALVRFYQGLAELKALGFVKPSKRKTDHIAKLKWL